MSWVQQYLRRAKGRLERDLDVQLGRELGCGSFGCALRARRNKRDLVLKITVDKDEIAMWLKLIELLERGALDGSGLVDVVDVGEILDEVSVSARTYDLAQHGLVLRPNPKAKAFAILREPVDPMFTHDTLSRRARAVIDAYGSRDWALFTRAIDHVFAAGRFYHELRVDTRTRRAESMHEWLAKEAKVDVRDLRDPEDALSELRHWIAVLRRVPFATDLSATLASCLEQRIVFADLKLDNTGFRVGAGDPQVLIFDVGGTPV